MLPRDWNVRSVHNGPGLSEPLAGVATTTDAATASWLSVAGCDIPFFEPCAVAALSGRVTRSDGDRDRDRGRHVSADGGHPNPPIIVPVSERNYKPFHALCRRAAVRDNVSGLAPDDGFGALLNRLDDVEYVGFDIPPESVD